MSSLDVAVLVGSLRQGAYTHSIGKALQSIAPSGMTTEIIPIGDLPFYNPDLDEGTPPAPWTRFRQAIAAKQAVIFVTQEYNRSVPAVLKNALDVGSRPYGSSVWGGKPAAIISASPGNISGFGANHHLRQSLVFLDMPTLQQPEVYLAQVNTLIDDAGNLKPDTAKFLGGVLEKFAAFAAKNI
ncbi:NAD(P)H-dependent oxidoreductase [Xinfangfangia sp. D13-10-4-6]|uniref:NADPH-dependent FMN reductase n=1 Tax=Pseudogemmobacter hezensis TaxID=2737662 RepID=UPI001557CBE6|nr:NAD(P)H-dependent oxidoreductase [Pseudogemmobacter hezensis]NPD14328.1 NAD(P)H-dependent oxidoreductase [Pseudogemmobacter hezensis]